MLTKKSTPDTPISIPVLLCNLLLLAIFSVVLLATAQNRPWMHQAFTYSSYYIVLALSLIWLLALVLLWQYKQIKITVFFKQHWQGILVSFLLATLVFASVPKYFRVLSDETNLLSVAKSMTYYRTVENVTEGRWYYEMFWPTPAWGTEKRPFLFPFFTSLMHHILGYHIENVFVLNFFALWALLCLLYINLYPVLGAPLSFAGLLLVIAQPVISLSATSGSFEIFNFVFILASFLTLKTFLKEPGSIPFFALIMTLLMLANIRYESGIFLLVTLTILTLGGYLRLNFLTKTFSVGLAPLFLLPLIWQRILLLDEADSNLVQGSWIKAFSPVNAQHNITIFFKYILDISGQLGYAGILNGIGILALIALIIWTFKTKAFAISKNNFILALISVLSLIALFIIILSYQGGINDHPLNGRLYLPILIMLSLCPLFCLINLFRQNTYLSFIAYGLAFSMFIIYHPVAVEDKLTNNLMIIREYRYVDSFLKKNADKNTLVICGRPGQLIVSNYGALSYDTANKEAANLLQELQNHLFSKIYVVQSISYRTKAPLSDNALDTRYQLKTVDELQINGEYFFRISEVRKF